MQVSIYTKPNCGYCLQAKHLLASNGITYQEKILDVHVTRDQLVEQFPTAKTFPIIVVDNFYIGGYNELREYIAEHHEKEDAWSYLVEE